MIRRAAMMICSVVVAALALGACAAAPLAVPAASAPEAQVPFPTPDPGDEAPPSGPGEAPRRDAPEPESPPVVVPPPPAPAAVPAFPPQAETLTAGGALRYFMASRDYRTIRALKSILTPRLAERYDHDSAPFNGKRSIRLAAFDFTEQDIRTTRPGQAKPKPAAADGPPAVFYAGVRSLWEEQGEAVEKRTETVTIARQEDGTWRIAGLEQAGSERLRFIDQTAGVTTLRMVLRAWHRRDLETFRQHASAAFLKRYEGRDDALRSLIAGPPPATVRASATVTAGSPAVVHVAYQIAELVLAPAGDTATARVRLYDAMPGQPAPIAGQARTLRLVKKGPRWLLDAWE